MNFFTELKELTTGMDLTIRMKEKNGKITVSVEPNVTNSGKIVPLIVTGTPEELDAEFIPLITAPLQESKIALLNVDQHKQSVDEHVKEEAEEETPATGKSAKKGAKKPPIKKAAKKNASSEPALFAD